MLRMCTAVEDTDIEPCVLNRATADPCNDGDQGVIAIGRSWQGEALHHWTGVQGLQRRFPRGLPCRG